MTAATPGRRTSRRRPSPAPADRTQRQPRGAARREAILDAAIDVLARKGLRGVRLTDVAEAAGVTHPNVAYYFGSKERLLQEAVRERERKEAGFYGLDAELLSLRNLPETARLVFEDARSARLYVVLAADSLDPDDALHEFFTRRYAAARALVIKAVHNDQANGSLSATLDPEQASFEVLSVMMGLEFQWLMDPAHVDYLGVMQRYSESFFERHGKDVA
jgi:AcrR family transcriptional regulator